jgi:cobalt-zinc-cadmium efflux system protein
MSHSHAGHAHGQSRAGEQKGRLALVLGLSAIVLVVEIAGGILSNSLALLADAAHMTTDIAGLGLALFAVKFAERPATPARTYGYYRVEILAALANAVLLAGISISIAIEAWHRLRNPEPVATGTMLAVASVGLVANALGALLLRSGSAHSLNVKAAYFEVLGDMIASLGVIVAGIILRYTGWPYADPLVSIGIALFILPRAWQLLRESVGVLLEGTPANVNLPALREAVCAVQGVLGVHDLHVWTLTSGVNALSAHAVLAAGAPHQEVLAAVRQCLSRDFEIQHVTVQVESLDCDPGETHL